MLIAPAKIASSLISKSLRNVGTVSCMPKVMQQRRKLVRRARQHPAWITIKNDIRSYECQVLDVSAGGAKLVADIETPIGSTFRLSIVPHGIVRKKCEVVWRKGRVIGVRFAPKITKES
jgi:hypothetical protein